MRRIRIFLVVCATLVLPAVASAAPYVLGFFCSSCDVDNSTNRMYDDGLHGDGVAGDGSWGADIVSDLPAGTYLWWIDGLYGFEPPCYCGPPAVIRLTTSAPGEVIHFRYGGPPPGTGWGGAGIACDHTVPPDAELDLAYNPGFYLDPAHFTRVPIPRLGTRWSGVVAVPDTGTYVYAFLSRTGAFPRIGSMYTAYCPEVYCEITTGPMRFATLAPNTSMLFEFDGPTGYLRAVSMGPTPAHARTWGQLKSFYR